MNEYEDDDFVSCPVCGGSKISKVTNRACQLCKETGQIKKEHDKRLAAIRKDLTERLLQAEREYIKALLNMRVGG